MLLLLLLLFVMRLEFTAAVEWQTQPKNEETFDHLLLSQEWPFTYCIMNHSCTNTNMLQPLFNIHGLWPEEVKGECTGKFNMSQLEPLKAKLMKFWMDLKDPLNVPEKFWKHEYDKHGACAAVDPRFGCTLQYFQAALDLYSKYNITEMLRKSGIVPGPMPYKVSSIIDALTNKFGYPPEIECYKRITEEGKLQYVREIHICFEKDLTPRSCSRTPNFKDNTLLYEDTRLLYSDCNEGSDVLLPDGLHR